MIKLNESKNQLVDVSRKMKCKDYYNKHVKFIGITSDDYKCLYLNTHNNEVYIEC